MDKFAEALKQAIKNVQEQQGIATSKSTTTDCLYRAVNGAKCPVGHLIADEHYSPSFELNGVTDHDGIVPALEKSIGVDLSEDQVSILISIQEAHDESVMAMINASNESHDEDVEYFVEQFKNSISYSVKRGSLPDYCVID